MTHLIVDALLRAYQHGARMTRAAIEQRGAVDPDELARAANQARQQAQAYDRSARLLLSEIHDQYDIRRDKKRFVDGLRRYPLPVLQQAEKDFSKQVLAPATRGIVRHAEKAVATAINAPFACKASHSDL